MAYVEAPGYASNCRIIEIYADKGDAETSYTNRMNDKYYADNKPAQDIGLSPDLEED